MDFYLLKKFLSVTMSKRRPLTYAEFREIMTRPMKRMTKMSQRGFALPIVALFLGILMVLATIVLDTALSSRHAGKVFQQVLTAEQLAEAGIHKALFCMNATVGTNCGGTFGSNYVGETNVSFSGGTFTTTLAGSGATRTVTAVGNGPAGSRTVITDLTTVPPTDSIGFTYALQSGTGGSWMENGSGITGTMYSNGDIECKTTSATITGDAYSSKSGGKIDKCRVDYHAHADNILSSSVGGNAYYKNDPADISGTTVTGTKFANSTTPGATTLPIMDLQFWRDSAEAGGIITGDYAPADNSNLGPIKITGNLTMNNSVDVTIKGPVWVQGNIITGNSNSFTLDSSFGDYSTVILADDPADMVTRGKIDISNGTSIYGSGDPQSHILFASTNSSTTDTAPALSVSNNATGAVFYAINGTLRLQNNGGAKSLAGYRLFLDNNAIVTYVASEFTGQFSNSPGVTWGMKKGTWREGK